MVLLFQAHGSGKTYCSGTTFTCTDGLPNRLCVTCNGKGWWPCGGNKIESVIVKGEVLTDALICQSPNCDKSIGKYGTYYQTHSKCSNNPMHGMQLSIGCSSQHALEAYQANDRYVKCRLPIYCESCGRTGTLPERRCSHGYTVEHKYCSHNYGGVTH